MALVLFCVPLALGVRVIVALVLIRDIFAVLYVSFTSTIAVQGYFRCSFTMVVQAY